MKDRILYIMKQANMTQQEFAKAIEVSAASLSNIFNGKTNPTSNHVNAIHRRFPEINIGWLMFGEGDVYVSSGREEGVGGDVEGGVRELKKSEEPTPLFSAVDVDGLHSGADDVCRKDGFVRDGGVQTVREVVKYVDRPQRKITEIRIFFDDGTFEVYS